MGLKGCVKTKRASQMALPGGQIKSIILKNTIFYAKTYFLIGCTRPKTTENTFCKCKKKKKKKQKPLRIFRFVYFTTLLKTNVRINA